MNTASAVASPLVANSIFDTGAADSQQDNTNTPDQENVGNMESIYHQL